MKCCYPGCDRGVGLHRYCKAHRVWVTYLTGLKHAHCDDSCPDKRKEVDR